MPPILLIGLGRWGSQHLRILQSRLPAREIFIADPAPAAANLAASLGIPQSHFSHQFETFLPNARAAIVATPAPSHAPITRRLLEAGLDVLVEKPIATHSSEGFQLAASALRQNRVLQVGHILRFHPATEWLHRALASQMLGELRLVQCNFTNFKRPRPDTGITLADGVHLVDLCRALLQWEPSSVSIQTFDILHRGPSWDDASWCFARFGPPSRSVPAVLETHYFAPIKSRLLTLVGTQLTARCDFASSVPQITVYPHRHSAPDQSGAIQAVTQPEQIISLTDQEPLAAQFDAFLESLQSRQPRGASGFDGARAVQILELGLAANGGWADIPAPGNPGDPQHPF